MFVNASYLKLHSITLLVYINYIYVYAFVIHACNIQLMDLHCSVKYIIITIVLLLFLTFIKIIRTINRSVTGTENYFITLWHLWKDSLLKYGASFILNMIKGTLKDNVYQAVTIISFEMQL